MAGADSQNSALIAAGPEYRRQQCASAVQCYFKHAQRLIDKQRRRSCAREDRMEASASGIEKPADMAMAEDICTLLEQTILKYFPANESDRPRQASVPLVPPREEKPAA
jgi:hypothetical protein